MRREAIVQVGGYRPAFTPADDYDLWMRISEHFELANLEQVVFKYRIHSHQISVRRRKQQTLGSLAARAAATARRSGRPDPLNSVEEITPELLASLGISEDAQRIELVLEYKGWIKLMWAAGERSAALNAAIEMLKLSDGCPMDSRERSEMRLEVARLYWKNNRFAMSAITAGRAVMTRPKLTGRPVKLLLRRLRLV
jgi:hypothetical protein